MPNKNPRKLFINVFDTSFKLLNKILNKIVKIKKKKSCKD